MTAYSKKLIAFDLDGTLTESKAPIDKEMADLFVQLLARKKVAVIGGGGWPQFQSQFIAGLPASADNLSNLLLLPTSGTCLYVWKGNWVPEYQETLSQIDRDGIRRAFDSALKAAGYDKPEKQYGDIIEDRGSQVTFSALGQKAPIELKRQWDPDREKRRKIAAILAEKLPAFDIKIGGTTSIDVTKRGINKAYGIRKLEQRLKLEPEDIVFVGDSLFVGGNDYSAKATGVDCVAVSGPEETKKLIRSWLF